MWSPVCDVFQEEVKPTSFRAKVWFHGCCISGEEVFLETSFDVKSGDKQIVPEQFAMYVLWKIANRYYRKRKYMYKIELISKEQFLNTEKKITDKTT